MRNPRGVGGVGGVGVLLLLDGMDEVLNQQSNARAKMSLLYFNYLLVGIFDSISLVSILDLID
ncbi:MAG: hypothetical protein V7K77_26875 [Nostoc sp.]|uniref:hypothetical protein n=1 Tax=Nostoc sp. TaxID=1180 RepID=UPI002FFB52B0